MIIRHIDEFDKYVGITGFKGVKIGLLSDFFAKICRKTPANVGIQFFDAKLIASWEHIYFAIFNALAAFEKQTNISRSLPMEAMLYASAQHQIAKATKLLGITRSSSQTAVLLVGEKLSDVKLAFSVVSKHVHAEEDESVLELSDEKAALIKRAFAVSQQEIDTVSERNDQNRALADLVIERMALLATKR
ncbi:MAG: KEOPS complex subunit Cgi121 [Candidatus Bathyarchaeota archaeon]|nr:KEOPS complex subunit Cgi121 [Candidatus Bathyarchaeota archaeon]